MFEFINKIFGSIHEQSIFCSNNYEQEICLGSIHEQIICCGDHQGKRFAVAAFTKKIVMGAIKNKTFAMTGFFKKYLS
jgi:hypothetical protein